MGRSPYVTATTYPKQGLIGKRVQVMFQTDPDMAPLGGTMVRDDLSSPYLTVIRLDGDDRIVLGTECVYSFE